MSTTSSNSQLEPGCGNPITAQAQSAKLKTGWAHTTMLLGRIVLVHKGGSKKEVSNYRPIAIIHVICKLFMMLIRDSINGWVEESDILGDVQG